MTPPGALDRFRHIAIEGPIGVGKTTLARRLAAHLGAELLLEQPLDNPFLERFYADMPGYAFQAQLAFLFQRVKQMQGLAQRSIFTPSVVSDFMFEKDAIFARLTLGDEEYRLYRSMYEQVARLIVPPDLIVWLQAPPVLLAGRVRQRGITMEQHMPDNYLGRLCNAYAAHFGAEPGGGPPVVAVATDRFDPGRNEADFRTLLVRLAGLPAPLGAVGAVGAVGVLRNDAPTGFATRD